MTARSPYGTKRRVSRTRREESVPGRGRWEQWHLLNSSPWRRSDMVISRQASWSHRESRPRAQANTRNEWSAGGRFVSNRKRATAIKQKLFDSSNRDLQRGRARMPMVHFRTARVGEPLGEGAEDPGSWFEGPTRDSFQQGSTRGIERDAIYVRRRSTSLATRDAPPRMQRHLDLPTPDTGKAPKEALTEPA